MLAQTLDRVTKAESYGAGRYALTNPYTPNEYWMLERVIEDMQRGFIRFDLVIEDESRPQDVALYREP